MQQKAGSVWLVALGFGPPGRAGAGQVRQRTPQKKFLFFIAKSALGHLGYLGS